MQRIAAFALLFIFLISACAPGYPTPVIPSPDPVQPASTPQPEPLPSSVSGGGYPPVVFEAQDTLSKQLKITPEKIQVAGVEAVEWPDACLGLSEPDELCAQVITSGYRILLQIDLVQYEFHSNTDGTVLRQVSEVKPESPGKQALPALTWESHDCGQLSVTLDAVFYGKCGETLAAAPTLVPASAEKVTPWLQRFAAFEAETPAGIMSFHGFGPDVATPAEQRMMAEWAQLTFDAAQSGRTGAAWGLAFSYHREGGIAGFCDDVAVYLAGYADVTGCKGQSATVPLTASQLQKIYRWYDSYSQIDYSYTDPAVADAMTIVLNMPGLGDSQADEETVRTITEFAADLIAQVSFQQSANPAVLASAHGATSDFLTALFTGDYILGAKLYGGDTSILSDWNPDIQNDLPAWLERGCTQNGLNCLPARSLTYRGPDAEGALQFLVEYNNKDGTLFQRGPCCGEETGPITTSFLMRARQQGDMWQVLDLPPYIP